MGLDPRTFIVTTMLAALVMTVVFFAQARSFPASIKGFRTWGFALLAASIAAGLLATRGVIPDLLSVVLGNGLLAASIFLMIAAVSAFYINSVPWKLSLACTIFIVFGVIYSLTLEQSQQVRTMITSSGLMVLLGILSWVILKGRSTRKFQFGIYFTSTCVGITALVSFARLVTLLAGDDGHAGLLTDSPMQLIYLASYSINVLLVSVGFSIMGHEKLVEDFQALASRDELTDLYNRRYFTEVAEQEIQRAERYHRDISVILIDIDNFKAINDTHGHEAGDKVIKDIANVMRQNFRETDLFGRYGGEEFTVLLSETQMPDAVSLSERMREAIIQRLVKFENKEIAYTASFGVAHGQGEVSLNQLLRQADKALYYAKESGKNRVEPVPLGAGS